MADCATFEDAVKAQKLGFDIVGTTLCGYTKSTLGVDIPNYDMIHRIAEELNIPTIAEEEFGNWGSLLEYIKKRY